LALGAWFLQVIAASIFALFVLLPLHPLPDNAFPKLDEKWTSVQLASSSV
jgi:linoleoyl-CoA desaturase